MSILVDTSVWSLAFRHDSERVSPKVVLLGDCLDRGVEVMVTGLVIQELLQGFHGPKQAKRILKELSRLPLIVPDLEDHVAAAELRNHCRRRGVQVGTIDALLAALSIRHELRLLTTDKDFEAMARHCPIRLL